MFVFKIDIGFRNNNTIFSVIETVSTHAEE